MVGRGFDEPLGCSGQLEGLIEKSILGLFVGYSFNQSFLQKTYFLTCEPGNWMMAPVLATIMGGDGRNRLRQTQR
jgi:hypothetical protein